MSNEYSTLAKASRSLLILMLVFSLSPGNQKSRLPAPQHPKSNPTQGPKTGKTNVPSQSHASYRNHHRPLLTRSALTLVSSHESNKSHTQKKRKLSGKTMPQILDWRIRCISFASLCSAACTFPTCVLPSLLDATAIDTPSTNFLRLCNCITIMRRTSPTRSSGVSIS